MPMYEYVCKDCGLKFEELQLMNEDALTTCSKCSGTLKRLISRGFVDVLYSAKEHLEKEIKPEARKIAEKIRAGDEDAAADLFGEK